MTQTYEAWRITYQSSEQAARAAFERMMQLEQGKCLLQIEEPAAEHIDDLAVGNLEYRMKAKLAKQRAKGYGGWNDTAQCSQQRLSDMLRGHVDKGDPVDVANFCAFLLARGEGIAAAPQAVQPAVPVDMHLVPAEFVRGFGDLAHNYSLAAVAPDYYHGVERDAFSAAYKRCGNDLAKLREILTAAPAHPAEGVHCSVCGADEAFTGTCGGGRSNPRALCFERAAIAATQPAAQQFQARVGEWLMECFGHDIAHDGMERNHRFLEEALELVQSLGCTASEAHQLVDYVFGRPVGEPVQELGGVMVTLAALCFAHELDMTAGADKELARICDPATMAKIKAKQAAKPRHSPLPQLAAIQPAAQGLDALTQAARSVLAERARQIVAEGWTPEKDDAYNPGVLAEAGGIYALHAFDPRRVKETPEGWPWSPGWWKPKDPRTNLVKAGALVLAEIERIDRTYAAQAKQGGA